MARKPRLYTSSEIYHVIMRGNNQQNIFFENSDFHFFRTKLKKYSHELNIEIYAYCFMNNHIHMLIGKANKNLSLFIQKLANSYVYFFNHKYERSGHLFQGRFKSEPITNDKYFKTVLRYILQNSDISGLGPMEEYKWNSYKAFLAPDNYEWIKTDYIFSLFENKKNLLSFIQQKTTDKCMEYENKFFIPDIKAIKLIKQLFNIDSTTNLVRIDPNISRPKLKILKKAGLSINQLSRLTGISKVLIQSA